MRVTRHVVIKGWDPDVIESVDVIVLLVHNENGLFHFIKGSKRVVHKIFVEGSLRWPCYAPWREETKEAIMDVLNPHCCESEGEIVLVSDSMELYANSLATGRVNFSIDNVFLVERIPTRFVCVADDALMFLSSQGKVTVAGDGWPSEKKELMFYGARVLFGEETAGQLEEAVFGKRILPRSGENEEMVIIDLTLFHRQLVKTRRANRDVGDVVLAPTSWEALADSESREGRPPCPN